jgi:hypothetical protein
MAAVTAVRVATATLSAATADVVTLTSKPAIAELVHHGNASDPIYFRVDGTTAVSAAAENEIVLAGERLRIALPDTGIASVISAGTVAYSLVAQS